MTWTQLFVNLALFAALLVAHRWIGRSTMPPRFVYRTLDMFKGGRPRASDRCGDADDERRDIVAYLRTKAEAAAMLRDYEKDTLRRDAFDAVAQVTNEAANAIERGAYVHELEGGR